MKSRMKLDGYGNFRIWNYWEPAGAGDYSDFGLPKHWIGRHPNAGYYDIDVEGIVTAYEHSLVFNTEDIDRLINTALAEADTGRPWCHTTIQFEGSSKSRTSQIAGEGSPLPVVLGVSSTNARRRTVNALNAVRTSKLLLSDIVVREGGLIRKRLAEFSGVLPIEKIELSSDARLPGEYAAGHSLGVSYYLDTLPDEAHLRSDLQTMPTLSRCSKGSAGKWDSRQPFGLIKAPNSYHATWICGLISAVSHSTSPDLESPPDNAFIEAFNGRFRAECLNAHWFLSLADAEKKVGGLAQVLQ